MMTHLIYTSFLSFLNDTESLDHIPTLVVRYIKTVDSAFFIVPGIFS